MAKVNKFLKRVDLFSGLTEEMLVKVAALCRPASYAAGSKIIERDSPSEDFYLVEEGTVEIFTAPEEDEGNHAEAMIITLGEGQSFGEMGLIDSGPRSATVKAATSAELLAINCQNFRDLCETDTTLGYRVMRNIAADLSFKLRHRNLI